MTAKCTLFDVWISGNRINDELFGCSGTWNGISLVAWRTCSFLHSRVMCTRTRRIYGRKWFACCATISTRRTRSAKIYCSTLCKGASVRRARDLVERIFQNGRVTCAAQQHVSRKRNRQWVGRRQRLRHLHGTSAIQFHPKQVRTHSVGMIIFFSKTKSEKSVNI
jgi:hypothetical protein